MNTFSSGEMIRFGWETFKKRSWFFVGAFLLYMIASWIIGFLSGFSGSIFVGVAGEAAGGVVSFVVSWLLNILLSIGFIAFLLKAHDAPESVRIADFWHPQHYLNFFGTTVLVFIVVIIGFVLLIVPGIIFGLMLMFSTYIVVDRGLSPIEAMKESKRITNGYKWDLVVLGIVLALINILGAICLLVGLLVSIPVTMLAMVHAYRTLEQRASAVTTPAV